MDELNEGVIYEEIQHGHGMGAPAPMPMPAPLRLHHKVSAATITIIVLKLITPFGVFMVLVPIVVGALVADIDWEDL